MIKQIAWNTFKNTGNIKTMMELLEMDKVSLENKEDMKLIENTKENIKFNSKEKGVK